MMWVEHIRRAVALMVQAALLSCCAEAMWWIREVTSHPWRSHTEENHLRKSPLDS